MCCDVSFFDLVVCEYRGWDGCVASESGNDRSLLLHQLHNNRWATQTPWHGLSQQGVWVLFGHPNPQKSSLRTSKFICEESFLKIVDFKLKIELFHLNIIPMALYKDIMP